MSRIILFILLVGVEVCYAGQFITYAFGGRNNMLYVPTASGTKPLPVFVMLHGCTQNPSDFAAGTKMNTYAEQYGFFALYPEQPSSANSNKCWNWFEPAHQSRGSGEPALITNIAQSLASKYKVDNSSFFIGGLSAGGAMTDIMGVTYPDVFRGILVGAGLEYKAATSVTSAYTAMSSGGPNPVTQGQVAYQAMGKYAKTLLVMVVHGTSDYTVYPVNGQQVVSSFAKTLDFVVGDGKSNGYITDTPTTTTNGQVPGGRAYITKTYADNKSGVTYIQYISVTSMGHAWSGGSSSGSYTDPSGPDASLLMVQWFLGLSPTTSSTGASSTATSSTVSTTSGTATTSTATATTTSTSSTSTTGGNTRVFTSIAAEDGFVGKLAADGFSNTICKIGDKGMYNVDDYRTILSFDTSSLGKTPISSAVLTITRQSMADTLAPLFVDIKGGTFGATTTLQQSYYYGTPDASSIGTIAIPANTGSSSSFQIPAASLRWITSGNSRTQIMLRQDTGKTTPSMTSSVLQIYDGQATLTVTL